MRNRFALFTWHPRMTMTMGDASQSNQVEVVTIDKDAYLRMPGRFGGSDKWMRVDASKVKAGGTFDLMPDSAPAGAGDLVSGVTDVERAGDRAFTGTLDLTGSLTAAV